ncbi:hypothetical protein [Streptomyces corynorhini]|uniref:Uncharacterized protein n=1 Tax=Streptomyces corynorhini TaxID=2282652 RepID=A0A370BCN4_9ACTN|nr:hypothetical protein [Streptomyces corynorhini]RDG37964.1 hypothetical protein DVH02_11615 [Streptomyces corynorhini]
MDLDALEREGGRSAGPFTVRHGGRTYTLADPCDLHWRTIARLGADVDHDTRVLLGDQADMFRCTPMPAWKMTRMVAAWREHHGLGNPDRLLSLLDRYSEAIDADLADRGWDLAQLWARRRWRFILNIVEHLPSASHTLTAMADDDELAAQIPEPEPGPPPLAGWSPEIATLTLIADRLGEVVTAIHNTTAKKPGKPPPPLPRPQTAHDRLARRRRRASHQLIKDRLLEASTRGRPTMAAAPAADARHAAHRTHTNTRG